MTAMLFTLATMKPQVSVQKGNDFQQSANWLRLSQLGGAIGILELNQVPSGQSPKDYRLISSRDPRSDVKDQFFFNANGYKLPTNIPNLGSVWSLSTEERDFAWALNYDTGEMFVGYIYGDANAVWCISK